MLVEQAHDLISAHTTDERTLFLYASDAFQRILGINTQVGSACFRVALPRRYCKSIRSSRVTTAVVVRLARGGQHQRSTTTARANHVEIR